MHFQDWLIFSEFKTQVFDVYLEELLITKRINSIINESLRTTGFLEEKLINEGFYKPKSSLAIMLENQSEEGTPQDEDEGEATLEDPFSGGEDAAPIEDLTKEPQKIKISNRRKKMLKTLKDLMLKIRWVAMKEREDDVAKLKSLENQLQSDPSNAQIDNEKRNLLKKLGYIKDLSADKKEIDKATKSAIRETGNEEHFASIVQEPLRVLINKFGEVATELFKFSDPSKSEFQKSGARYRVDPGDVLNSYFEDMVNYLTKRKRSGWSPLVAGLGKSLSDLENDEWTDDPDISPRERGILNQVLSYNKSVIYTTPKTQMRKSVERSRLKDKIKNRTEIQTILSKDIQNNRLDFYKKYLEDIKEGKAGQARSFPEDENYRQPKKVPIYRKKIMDHIIELSKEKPEDYSLSPITYDNIKKLLTTYRSYEVIGSKKSAVVKAASELSKDDDEGGSDRESALWAAAIPGSSKSSWAGSSTGGDPAEIASQRETSQTAQRVRDALEQLLSQHRDVGMAFCVSLGLDCASGVPDNLELSPLFKTIASGTSTKIDLRALKSKLVDLGMPEMNDGQLRTMLFKARNFMKDKLKDLDPETETEFT